MQSSTFETTEKIIFAKGMRPCIKMQPLLSGRTQENLANGGSSYSAMRLLGGRWRMLLASFLLDSPRRFNELRRDLPNISQPMPTVNLRAIDDARLVQLALR